MEGQADGHLTAARRIEGKWFNGLDF